MAAPPCRRPCGGTLRRAGSPFTGPNFEPSLLARRVNLEGRETPRWGVLRQRRGATVPSRGHENRLGQFVQRAPYSLDEDLDIGAAVPVRNHGDVELSGVGER